MASGSGIIGIKLVLNGVRETITDTNKLKTAFRELGDDRLFNGISKGVTGVGLAVGAAAAGASVAVGAFVKTSLDSLNRIERINAQTANAIKSTGAAAGVTADHVIELTGALEGTTATEAESIQQGANLLLTFTNIKNGAGETNQVFDDTVKIMTDMSRAMDTTGGVVLDTSATAIQLGKALNDPIKGVTALRKVGVSFSEEQQTQIKNLVESNDLMGAQRIILNELSKEFGGSGEAFAKTSKGQIELALHAVGTFGEALSSALGPAIGAVSTQFADLFNYAAENVPNLEGTFTRLADKWVSASTRIVSGVKYVIDNFDDMKAAANTAFSGGPDSRAAVEKAGAGIGGALGLSPEATTNLTNFMQTFVAGAQGVLAALTPVWQGIQNAPVSTLGVLQGVMQWMADHTTAVQVMASALTTVAVAVTAVRVAITIWTAAQAALNFVLSANPIGLIIIAVAALVGGLIIAYQKSETFRGIVNFLWTSLKQVAGVFWDVIKAVGKFIYDFTPLGGLIKTVQGNWDSITSAIGKFVDKIKEGWNWAKKLIDQIGQVGNLGGGIGDVVGGVLGFRAEGGPVAAGQPYIVGEQGPELMVPGRSGRVLNNAQTVDALSGSLAHLVAGPSGDTVVPVTVTLDGRVLLHSVQRHAAREGARR